MSPPISIADVYHAMNNNDQRLVERALLYFGIRIHKIHIWCDMIPLVYCAFVGNFEIFRLLLQDFEKYLPNDKLSTNSPYDDQLKEFLVDTVVHTLLRHRHEKTDDVLQVLLRIAHRFGDLSYFLYCLVSEGAFEFIEAILKDSGEKYFGELVHICIQVNLKGVYNIPERIRAHEDFVRELKVFECDYPLILAMVRGDVEALKTALAEEAKSDEEDDEFVEKIVRIESKVALDTLLEPEQIRYTMEVAGYRSENEFITALVTEALNRRSCRMLKALISHEKFGLVKINWLERYYELMMRGDVKCAASIYHLVDFSDAKTYREVNKCSGNLLERVTKSISAEDFLKVIDCLMLLSTDIVGFRNCVKTFPIKNLRPDLMEILAKKYYLVLPYLKIDVFNTEWNKAVMRYPCVRAPLSDGLVRISAGGDRMFSAEHLMAAFLGPKQDIVIRYLRNGCEQLEFCVRETGKSVQPSPMSMYSSTYFKSALDSKRRESLTLKKRCRIAIRNCVVERRSKTVSHRRNRHNYQMLQCDLASVLEDLAWLNFEGYLPPSLVYYLSYRESPNSLYYELHRQLLREGKVLPKPEPIAKTCIAS